MLFGERVLRDLQAAIAYTTFQSNLVDPASSHMLVSKIKPCMSKYELSDGETANGSIQRL